MTDSIKWQILIPLRGGVESKTRLTGSSLDANARTILARAFAADVASAVLEAPTTAGLTIVTADPETAKEFGERGANIFAEKSQKGLNSAVRTASEHLLAHFSDQGIAALMGDLPSLTSESLTEALSRAERLDRGVLADHDGTGTTLLTATRGQSLTPSYGSGSYARHVALGHEPITGVPEGSPLRRDVDTVEDLVSLARLGFGPHTREALGKLNLGAHLLSFAPR